MIKRKMLLAGLAGAMALIPYRLLADVQLDWSDMPISAEFVMDSGSAKSLSYSFSGPCDWSSAEIRVVKTGGEDTGWKVTFNGVGASGAQYLPFTTSLRNLRWSSIPPSGPCQVTRTYTLENGPPQVHYIKITPPSPLAAIAAPATVSFDTVKPLSTTVRKTALTLSGNGYSSQGKLSMSISGCTANCPTLTVDGQAVSTTPLSLTYSESDKDYQAEWSWSAPATPGDYTYNATLTWVVN